MGKCDGLRPSCYTCRSHGRDCVYSTNPTESRVTATKRRQTELEQSVENIRRAQASLQVLIDALQVREEDEAMAIFRRLRQVADVTSVIEHIKAGDLLMQIHLTPETRLRYEFPYRAQMPSAILTTDNPYLKSLLYGATYAVPNGHFEMGASVESPWNGRHSSPYLKPYATATIADPRFDVLRPSRWTTVSDDDDTMRMLLKLYFLYEHQFFSCFHKDLFLEDLASGSKEFCSEVLVNAVLAIACVSMVKLIGF